MKIKQIIIMLVSGVLVLMVFATEITLSNNNPNESEKVSVVVKHSDLYKDANERIVLKSVPSEYWHQNIYLMADKITWMDFENFAVQVGDMGGMIYHFPNWYHGKYEPKLFDEDVSGDKFDDLIIVLNNDKASAGKPRKEVHVLNFIKGQGYEEAKVEPIQKTKTHINSNVTLRKHGKFVTIRIGDVKYTTDISKYNYPNPREPFVISYELIDYSFSNGQLIGIVPLYVLQETTSGGLIGYLILEYTWDGIEYVVKQLNFREYNFQDEQFLFP
ncbi:hypothetical protein [Paenisporosarcina sp. TG20]|uniref:hypothetical protein n=1 Tax=Paenisporosarcina sp. TG20 TaxID=1211706 RepID=UPI0002E54D1B|nr:hypothetical protein [Paenisporosarcina sp. TG20]